MQIDDLDAGLGDGVQKLRREDVHPARADDDVRAGREVEDQGGEGGVVGGACGGRGGRVRALEGEEVVVGGGDGGLGGALEAVGGFATVAVRVSGSGKTSEGAG